ncbi:MAG: sensor histidine kinase [Hoeflea sp.]|uniref:sensor histidine kinase n=1 Tax=Hoeflea sp. TaxID=1940281 RepID=UPI0032EDC445
MTFFEWLEIIYAYCTSAEPVANWRPIAISANIAIALAYFWIPTGMGIVFYRWRREIPFPWLWTGFAVFIIACGVSHVAHAFHALRQATPYTAVELAVLAATAAVSLVTAIGFTVILPRIMTLTAPSEIKKRLESEVERATADLEQALEAERLLLLEVHHRVKNNLQITASLVGLHLRQVPLEHRKPLEVLRARIHAMADIHNQLQEAGVSRLSAGRFMDELCRKSKVAFGREDVTHSLRGDDWSVSFEQATPFSLLMNEVVSQIFKQAFADGAGSRIEIRFSRNEGLNRTSVSDDGSRIVHDGAEVEVEAKLIRSLAEQLGARVSWTELPDGGNEFAIEFEAG